MVESLKQLSEFLKFDYLATDKSQMIAMIVLLVVSIVFCFFGYRAVRGLAAVFGFVIGACVGTVIARAFALQQPVDLVVIFGAAILLALLGCFLLRAGIFIIVLLGVTGVVLPILRQYTAFADLVMLIISLVIGLVVAILSVIYLKPVVIAATAIIGAASLSQLIFTYLVHIRWSKSMEILISAGALALFAVIGMVYQYASTKDLD